MGFSFHQNCNKSCIGWFKALRGHLIGPKNLGPNYWKVFGDFWIGRDSPEFQWVWFVLICVLNVCLVHIGPGKTVDFEFTK